MSCQLVMHIHRGTVSLKSGQNCSQRRCLPILLRYFQYSSQKLFVYFLRLILASLINRILKSIALSGSIKCILIVCQSWRFFFDIQIEILYHVYTHRLYVIITRSVLFTQGSIQNFIQRKRWVPFFFASSACKPAIWLFLTKKLIIWPFLC